MIVHVKSPAHAAADDDDWGRSDKCRAWVVEQKINRVGGNQPCE
jgi:hypothetical protein